VKLWGSLLSIPETEVSSIRYLLLLAGSIALIAVAIGFYFRTFRKLQSVERELVESRKHPPRFQDDFDLDERLHLYRHKTKPGIYFCVACVAAASRETPMRKQDNGWVCPVESAHFVPDPDYKAPPSQPIYRSGIPHFEPRRLSPGDF
jgi:hypothetical protein